MESVKVWESCSIAKLASTKVNGKMIPGAAVEWSAIQMETNTRVIS